MNQPLSRIWGGVGRTLNSARARVSKAMSAQVSSKWITGPTSSVLGGALGGAVMGGTTDTGYSRSSSILGGAALGAGMGYGVHRYGTSIFNGAKRGLNSMASGLASQFDRAASRVETSQSAAEGMSNFLKNHYGLNKAPLQGKTYKRYPAFPGY